jgi:predicted nucleic acid-binding protein
MANRVFLDTSAFFAGIWSATGGARMLLKLGETGAIQLLVSSQVLTEMENVLRRKAPEKLGVLALVLNRSGVDAVPAPTREAIRKSQALLDYMPDIQVLAAAWAANVDYFTTLDQRHFLDNSTLTEAVPFPVGTPGDCLAWFRAQLV